MARVKTCVHCGRTMFDATYGATAVRCPQCGRLSRGGGFGDRLRGVLPLVLAAMMTAIVFSAYWLGRTVERDQVREQRYESR